MPDSTAAKLDQLTKLMTSGFAAIADDIADLKDRMVSRDDVRGIVREAIHNLVPDIVAVELGPIHKQLRDIEHRLDTVQEHYADMRGFAKEIDDLRVQVKAIRKHLGLAAEIAA